MLNIGEFTTIAYAIMAPNGRIITHVSIAITSCVCL
jgi:hypothetical protein